MVEHYEVVILGGTPAGISCGVRAAREGLSTLLISHGKHLGGIMSAGLGGFDTLYDGRRSPILDELMNAVRDHYETTYGTNSSQYAAAVINRRRRYEPHVAERIFEDLVAGEPLLTVLRGYHPVAVERTERLIQALHVESDGDESRRRFTADTFVDCSYEGDLAAYAGVPYRVGREDRNEFGEPHAGRIFTVHGWYHCPREAREGQLNQATFGAVSQEVFAGSTGEGDSAIQAFNFRVCLTSNPDNRRPIEQPPDYDRTRYLGIVEDQTESLDKRYPIKPQLLLNDIAKLRMDPAGWASSMLPNDKTSYNDANFPGENHAYPTADWAERGMITRRHWHHALGQLYFLQHDEAVPEHVREGVREWGLAKDEFVDNDNVPYEMYVREARRIKGRYTFTEHDGTLAPGLDRAPIHEDAIAIAEWPMDSHECTTDRQFGSLYDGKFLLSEKTRPSQVSYRTLLPEGLDNLLVPVCLSCTHVGWGTIRLEPTWMQIAEGAGFAAALARRQGTTVGELAVDDLQRELVHQGGLLTFFNDLDTGTEAPWAVAVQYLGTRGFFPTYDARAAEPLTAAVAQVWARAVGGLLGGEGDAATRARAVLAAEQAADETTVTGGRLAELLARELAYRDQEPGTATAALAACDVQADESISRGDACRVMYEVVNRGIAIAA